MSKYYHPNTKEHIPNPLPRVKEWAGEADTEAPAYDRDTETCHYRDGAWVVETIPDTSLDDEREQMVVNQFQARKALKDQELLSQVEDMMADPDTDEDVKLMWQFKERIRRLHSVTNQMLDALGMTEEEKDDLFRYGMSVEQ